MAKQPPIFIDDEHGSITRTQFRKLSKKDKLELMEAWFRHRYEDPVHRTPYESAEGGYQYIYGGPYSARDELSEFEGLVPEALIEEVVDTLEQEATEWTGTPDDDDYDDYDADEPDEDDGIEIHIPSEPEIRSQVLHRLEALEEALAAKPSYGGIGHNHPPESIEGFSTQDLAGLANAVADIKAELQKPSPNPLKVVPPQETVQTLSERLKAALAHKLDIASDEFAKEIGKKAAGIPFWYGVYEALHNFLGPLAHWVQVALGI